MFSIIGGLLGTVGSIFGRGRLFGGMIVLVTIGLAGYIGTLKYEIWSQGNTIEQQQVTIGQLENSVAFEKGEVKACKARIDETNKRITDLKDSTVSRDKIIDSLAENINTFRELSDARIKNIEDAPTPQSCEEAMEFLRNGLGERK